MSRICFRFLVLFVLFSISQCILTENLTYDEQEYNNYSNDTNEISEKSFTWLKSAQDMFASPAGHVVVQVAKELLNRSAGNSQVRSEVVLSLNLTNLLIILLLKVVIFAAGVLGAGHWSGGYGYGYNYPRSAARNDDGVTFGLRDGEGYLITGFLAAQGSGIDDCLFAAACGSPQIAYEYAKAAKALMEGIVKFEGNPFNNPRYNDLIVLVEKAAYDGFRGLPCNTTTRCDGLF